MRPARFAFAICLLLLLASARVDLCKGLGQPSTGVTLYGELELAIDGVYLLASQHVRQNDSPISIDDLRHPGDVGSERDPLKRRLPVPRTEDARGLNDHDIESLGRKRQCHLLGLKLRQQLGWR